MLHVALWEPEVPPNTGNVARLCAAVGARLHLIGRLGFRLDDKSLKRAGLDYWPAVDLVRHVTFEEFEAALGAAGANPERQRGGSADPLADARGSPGTAPRLWCIDNPAERPYTRADFRDGDGLLFGSETKGLPPGVRERYAGRLLGIPMPTGKVRSLNLATAVGVVLYEALRQVHRW